MTINWTHKLSQFGPCLGQRLRPKKNLIAGPYVGEFGYELMQWQGYVRARRHLYKEVHVLTYPGRDYLYEECSVHHHQVELRTAGYNYGTMSFAQRQQMADELARSIGLVDYDVFGTPLLLTRYHKMLFWRQEFRLFREPEIAGGMREIGFHFRAIDKTGHDRSRNYPIQQVESLVALGKEAGWRMIALGHPNYSLCPDGVEDCRSVDLRKSVAAICSARLIAGELSGPMHLANLCGQPTAFFADGQWRIDNCLGWNPFRVPLYVIANDTMRPEPELVFEKLQAALVDLARRSDRFREPVYTFPAQKISWV